MTIAAVIDQKNYIKVWEKSKSTYKWLSKHFTVPQNINI